MSYTGLYKMFLSVSSCRHSSKFCFFLVIPFGFAFKLMAFLRKDVSRVSLPSSTGPELGPELLLFGFC